MKRIIEKLTCRRGEVTSQVLLEILIAVAVCAVLLNVIFSSVPDLGLSLTDRMQTLFSK